MRTNTQEAIVSAYIVSVGKRTPRDAAQDAAELCRLAGRDQRALLWTSQRRHVTVPLRVAKESYR